MASAIELPREIVHRIMDWVFEFDRREALERVTAHVLTWGESWASVMADVRSNTPRYTVQIETASGYQLRMSVFTPDCNPVVWEGRALGSSFLYFRRRALSVCLAEREGSVEVGTGTGAGAL
jgi:hypothetical protein